MKKLAIVPIVMFFLVRFLRWQTSPPPNQEKQKCQKKSLNSSTLVICIYTKDQLGPSDGRMNLYNSGVVLGPQNDASFEGSSDT